mmetsp:Transcript_111293/g.354366  ORF Transcript_111293/g.354366 Transcript_111293/m.354366 type:complete len:262 (+) Transcript_111293:106-891(+)
MQSAPRRIMAGRWGESHKTAKLVLWSALVFEPTVPYGTHFPGVGARLWPASCLLAQLLLSPAPLGPDWAAFLQPAARHAKPLRVLELGAGTALPSVCLACLGHTSVSTDLPEIMPVLQANLDANRSRITGDASAQSLVFGDRDAAAKLGEFDLVVGSDISYDPVSYGPLLDTLRAIGGTWRALVSISQRPEDLGEETFENACRDEGVSLRLRYTAFVGNITARRVNVYEMTSDSLSSGAAERSEVGMAEIELAFARDDEYG